jgi:hypothetical protein
MGREYLAAFLTLTMDLIYYPATVDLMGTPPPGMLSQKRRDGHGQEIHRQFDGG